MRSRSTLFCGNFSAKNEQFLLLSKPRKPLEKTLPNIYKKECKYSGGVDPLVLPPSHTATTMTKSTMFFCVCFSARWLQGSSLQPHVCRHQDPNQHHTWRPSPGPVSKTAAKWVQLGVVQNFLSKKVPNVSTLSVCTTLSLAKLLSAQVFNTKGC